MCKKLLLPVMGMLCYCFSASAKIWRVNNNPNVVKDFTTIQAAHDGAASGDTLHIEGSQTAYGNLNCTKRLAIIGPGYFLNQNADLQASLFNAVVSGFTFYAGSEGSVVMGLNFASQHITLYSSNITIRRNKFSDALEQTMGFVSLYYITNNPNLPVNDIIISQNFGLKVMMNYASSNILIQNNFISRYSYEGVGSNAITIHSNANAVVLQNNVIRGSVIAYNSNCTNNIQTEGSFAGSGNLISNNIGSGTQFGTASGNQENVVMADVFIASGSSNDGNWKLKPGSPALGAGYGSTQQNPVDCGMFGGTSPYVLSGIPPLPAIYSFTNQPIGSNNDPIDVNIKVRSNN